MNHSVYNELLDVVDKNDQVIGSEIRGKIHQLGLMHRAVHILVFNNENKLFIQKRSMSKDENPGLWDTSAAGHLDSGEIYYDCAIRELNEELGISIESTLAFIFRLEPTELTGMEHCNVYQCHYNGPIKLQPEEIDEGKWITADEMDQCVSSNDSDLTDVLRLIWQRYRQQFTIPDS